jgi:UDP-3-O-[3-hydroxymyristoyl] N-acetylglucosamine deacetylase
MPSSSHGTWQRTIQLKASVAGVGLHTGKTVRLTLAPAPVDSGIRFVRTDLRHPLEIPARSEYVVDTTLNTTLGRDGHRIGTVEHLLSALYGLGVDNVRVEVDGPEIPILDGSAAPFVRLIDQVGVREQKAPRRVAYVRKAVTITDGDKEVRLTPSQNFSIHCAIDFNHPLITNQKFGVEVNAKSFIREISRARTFGFAREVEMLRSRGLALGGSLENAIVIDDFHILNPDGLRFPDEFVRHKILDAIGDLALVGVPVIGQLHAHKSGHALNQRLVRHLLSEPGLIEVVALGEVPASRPAAQAAVEMGLALEGSLA